MVAGEAASADLEIVVVMPAASESPAASARPRKAPSCAKAPSHIIQLCAVLAHHRHASLGDQNAGTARFDSIRGWCPCGLMSYGVGLWLARLARCLGLPAAVLAAVAGATALASAAGRFLAGIGAVVSSALTATVTFLDYGKKRDKAAVTGAWWTDLYDQI